MLRCDPSSFSHFFLLNLVAQQSGDDYPELFIKYADAI